jgi:Predicted flavoprotein
VEAALEGAAESGAETRLIDLNGYNLIFRAGQDETGYPSDVARLRAEVKQADGIILGTPEYHGSLSGVLKNALDLMGFDEFEGKMIGLVGVSGGQMGAFDALKTLRNIGRALHAWVIRSRRRFQRHGGCSPGMADRRPQARKAFEGRRPPGGPLCPTAQVRGCSEFRQKVAGSAV